MIVTVTWIIIFLNDRDIISKKCKKISKYLSLKSYCKKMQSVDSTAKLEPTADVTVKDCCHDCFHLTLQKKDTVNGVPCRLSTREEKLYKQTNK